MGRATLCACLTSSALSLGGAVLHAYWAAICRFSPSPGRVTLHAHNSTPFTLHGQRVGTAVLLAPQCLQECSLPTICNLSGQVFLQVTSWHFLVPHSLQGGSSVCTQPRGCAKQHPALPAESAFTWRRTLCELRLLLFLLDLATEGWLRTRPRKPRWKSCPLPYAREA